MIKRNNKILVGALALLLCLTVGYALFSDTLTINGTATAQGNFDLDYSCRVLTKENTPIGSGYFPSTGTGTCDIVDGKIITNSNLSKPTEETHFEVIITNNGTIPVVLKTVDSDNNYGPDESGDAIVEGGDMFYIDKEKSLIAMYDKLDNKGPLVPGGDSAWSAEGYVLEPGKTMNLGIRHAWWDNELLKNMGLDVPSQPVPPTEGFKMNYNITLGFEQIVAE